jgi:hypothetical protein
MGTTEKCDYGISTPKIKDENGWKQYCFGYLPGEDQETNRVESKDEGENNVGETNSEIIEEEIDEKTPKMHRTILQQKQQPSMIVLQNLEPVGIRKVLLYHIRWLTGENVDHYSPGPSELTEQQALWLFSLLAFIDEPLDDEVTWQIRNMLRNLCKFRKKLVLFSLPHFFKFNLIFCRLQLILVWCTSTFWLQLLINISNKAENNQISSATPYLFFYFFSS